MSDAEMKTTRPGNAPGCTASADASATAQRSPSMHEDVPVWYDCCSCEAEPYWVELMGETAGEEPGKSSA